MSTIIELSNIYKIYKSGSKQKEIETVALKEVNLTINENDFISIMGPSGSGKTSLLNIIAGLDRQTAGKLYFADFSGVMHDLTNLSEAELDEFKYNKVSVIFQSDNLLYHLSAKENVELPLKFLGIKNYAQRSVELLERVGLKNRINHYPYQLSSGERQRVALCSALAYNPMIIIADEPTGELDSKNVAEMMELMQSLNKEGMTFLVATHNPIVAEYAKRYFTIYDGKLIERHDSSIFSKIENFNEYSIKLDDFSRIYLPLELLEEINPTEHLLKISYDENSIYLTNIVANEKEGDFVQLDNQDRILLPKEIANKFNTKDFIGLYDEKRNQIVIKPKEEEK